METTKKKKEYKKEYYKLHKSRIDKYKKEYNKKNIKEKRAKDMLWQRMNRRGIKTTICSKCGSKRNVERHHPNYDEPLKFIELCKSCHKKEHSPNK